MKRQNCGTQKLAFFPGHYIEPILENKNFFSSQKLQTVEDTGRISVGPQNFGCITPNQTKIQELKKIGKVNKENFRRKQLRLH